MTDEGMSEEELERIIEMLESAGLVERTTLEDGRIQLSLTERGRQLDAVLPPELQEAAEPEGEGNGPAD